MNSNIHLIIQYIILLTSLIAGIIAWLSKLKWSKEFSNAKEAQIKSLKEMADFYKDIISSNLINFQKEQIFYLEQILNKQENKIKEDEEKIKINEQNLKNQEELITHSEKLSEVNVLLLQRQSLIEDQTDELRKHSTNLIEMNDLLNEKQALIIFQSEKLKEANQTLVKRNSELEEKIKILELKK
jgi:hypothetical protein